jgi:methionine synthase II (cobalamin-independent)
VHVYIKHRCSYDEKKSRFVSIIFILQARVERNDSINHIFVDVEIDVDVHKHNLRVMIDYEATENFINQLKIKKFNFEDNLSIKKDLKTLNETSLCIYHAHNVRFDVVDTENHCH